MILTKEQFRYNLNRVGLAAVAEAALRDDRLPDVIDTDRDKALLQKLGVNRGELVELMGGSP